MHHHSCGPSNHVCLNFKHLLCLESYSKKKYPWKGYTSHRIESTKRGKVSLSLSPFGIPASHIVVELEIRLIWEGDAGISVGV
jgi:hypothetical protein